MIITIILILGDDQMLIQGTTTSGSIRSRTPIDERIRIANIAEEVKKSKLADVQDLIHLQHPLSEDLVLRTLQARYFNKNYFVSLILGSTSLKNHRLFVFNDFFFLDKCGSYSLVCEFICQCGKPVDTTIN